MSNKHGPDDAHQPVIYQIQVKGHFGHQIADRFEELIVSLEDNGSTLLTGPVVDQAALYGILRQIRDLGMTLLSVNTIGALPEDLSTIKNESPFR